MIFIMLVVVFMEKVKILRFCNGKSFRLLPVCFRKLIQLIDCLLLMAQALMVKPLLCKPFVMCWAQPILRKLLIKKRVWFRRMVTHQSQKALSYRLLIGMLHLRTLVVCLNYVVISSNFVLSYRQQHHCVYQPSKHCYVLHK